MQVLNYRPWENPVKCDNLEFGHNEIILFVLKKHTSYLFIFDVFDADL